MVHIKNLMNNPNLKTLCKKGSMTVYEYLQDLSVTPQQAQLAYFASKLNIRKRQLFCEIEDTGIITQAGAMQVTLGDVVATTGVKGAGDFLGKMVRSKVTNESAIKPEYVGHGHLLLEPTYKHLILMDIAEWNGSVVLDDGLFLACDATIKHTVTMRNTVSSAVAGGTGMFNLCLSGKGVVCLESRCPRNELVELELEDDVVRIDGSMAIAWSNSLKFTVERSGKSLLGSSVSGEGLVNVYRGTGRIWMMPVSNTEFGMELI